MNQAEKIAAMFGNDGQQWATADGESLDDACEAAGGVITYRDGWGTDTYKYTFADGSVITVAGAAWDFGYEDCWCWAGLGHDDEPCTAKNSSRDDEQVDSDFAPTHKITVTDRDGGIEEIYVQLDDSGAAYTREEWDAEIHADWTYDDEEGWQFLGSVGPTDWCQVEVETLRDEQ